MKKELGINVWAKIQKVLNENRDIIEKDTPHNQVLRLIAIDPDLDFYFELGKMNNDGNYVVKYKPSDLDTVRTIHSAFSQPGVIQHLELWADILRKWAITPTPYDDDIEKFYQKEYFDQYKFVDPVANVEPFADHEQKLLGEYIEYMKDVIADKKEEASEREIVELISAEQQCELVKENLTRWSKNRVVNGLAKAWGKLKKFGRDFGNNVAAEASKALAKGVVSITPEKVHKIIDTIREIGS